MIEIPPPGHTTSILPPGESSAWRLQATEACAVLTTPGLDVEPADRAATLRGCLWSNLSDELLASNARYVVDEQRVALELVVAPDSLEAALQQGQALFAEARIALEADERSSAQSIEEELDEAGVLEDIARPDLDLLAALEALAERDAELSALLSIDPIQGCGLFEPDDESWMVAVTPANDADKVTLSVAIAPMPDGDEACPMLERSLDLGAALSVGPAFRVGCDPQATVLLLTTRINPRTADSDALKAAIGGLLVLSDRLADRVLDSDGPGSTAALSAPIPAIHGSLSSYLQDMA